MYMKVPPNPNLKPRRSEAGMSWSIGNGMLQLRAIIYMTKHQQHVDMVASGTIPTAPEITLAMIEAGVLALETYREAYSDGLLVEAVYTAMCQRASEYKVA
jgi:hypothetical protein